MESIDTKYLTDNQVILMNGMVINKYTPGEPIQLRDSFLLNSAVSRPQQTFAGKDVYPDIFHKAAALFESLVTNHPFVNGNKRTAWLATTVFLRLNGYIYRNEDQQAVEDFVVDFVNKKLKFDDVVIFLSSNSDKT